MAVETRLDGDLEVGWTLEGEPAEVDIAVGRSPDGVDHRHETTVAPGVQSVRLPARGAGRVFVSVRPVLGGGVVAAERRVGFTGVPNFRDLGGYPTRSGGRVRWGRVFRSGALDGLSPTDLALYDGLGIRTVFDLRTDVEREERPSAVASCSLTLVGRPSGGAASPPGPAPRTAAEAEQRLLDLYCGLLDHGAAEIGTLLTTLAGDDGLPAVIHCQAGKDRTGVVTAVLLELLGVDRTVVVEDYALTERYLERDRLGTTVQRLLALGYSEEAVAALLGTSVPAMAAALEHLDGQHGGIERYLTGPAGMHPDQMDRLRRRLVDTAD